MSSHLYTLLMKIKKILKYLTVLLLIILLVFLIWFFLNSPSNNRDWATDQAILPYSEINGSKISIYNIRNFSYKSVSDFIPNYYDKVFDLDDIETVWYVVEPFAGYKGAAHTFLSFGFKNGQYISISVEIRKEKGESFSAVKGLVRQYELMYVIADERDVIKLRTNYRKDEVFLYPVKTTRENMRTLFLDMITRANKLNEKPEFYNTLTSTCTTNIVEHVNKISPKRIPLASEIIFPAESDRLAYELGLINTNLSFDDARKKFHINERALKYADYPNFSQKIRN